MLKKYLSDYFEKNANRREIYVQVFLLLEVLVSKKRESLQRKGEYKMFNETHWDEARDKAIDEYSEKIKEAINDTEKAKKLTEGATNYFKGIHYFKIIDVYNKLKKKPLAPLNDAINMQNNDEEIKSIIQKKIINWCVSALPFKQRICLYLHKYQDMGATEISKKVETIKPDAVRKNYEVALKKLSISYKKLENKQLALFVKSQMQIVDNQVKIIEKQKQFKTCFEMINNKNVTERELLSMLNISFHTLEKKHTDKLEDWLQSSQNTTEETEKILDRWQDTICFYLDYFHQNKD